MQGPYLRRNVLGPGVQSKSRKIKRPIPCFNRPYAAYQSTFPRLLLPFSSTTRLFSMPFSLEQRCPFLFLVHDQLPMEAKPPKVRFNYLPTNFLSVRGDSTHSPSGCQLRDCFCASLPIAVFIYCSGVGLHRKNKI